MISRWRCQVRAGVPGAERTARPIPQIRPGTSHGAVSSRSFPVAFARSTSSLTSSISWTPSAALTDGYGDAFLVGAGIALLGLIATLTLIRGRDSRAHVELGGGAEVPETG